MEDLFADGAHLTKDLFQLAMIGNGLLVKERLVSSESQADGLSLYFASEPPRVRRLGADATLRDPAEFLKLALESLITSLKPAERGGR